LAEEIPDYKFKIQDWRTDGTDGGNGTDETDAGSKNCGDAPGTEKFSIAEWGLRIWDFGRGKLNNDHWTLKIDHWAAG
jgi:hypothetical protein